MIKIHTKNMSLSPHQEERAYSKMEKLLTIGRRIGDESTTIKVEIDFDDVREKDKKIFCVITIHAPRSTMRAEVHEKTVENALDSCDQKLRKQIEKFKAKNS